MFLYRLGSLCHRKSIPLAPNVFSFLIRLIHNCVVYSETNIGEGTIFAYGGIAVVVHKRSVIGKGCVIGSGVTIGGRSKSLGLPVIGDNVYIATGAKVLGEVKVGNDCVIGANAVVIDDVPDGAMVVGVPARIIRTGIVSRDYF